MFVLLDSSVATPSDDERSGSAPPRITWTHPGNGQNKIPLDVTIQIVFSAEMDRASVEAALWLDPYFQHTLTWINSSELNLRPVGPLAYFSDYMFIVNMTATDVNGSSLEPYPWTTFFTEKSPDPIHVVRTSPAHQARDVPETTTITIVFSRPMDHASTLAAFRKLPNFEASLTWTLEGSGESLTIFPARELETSQFYNFYIDFTAQSADGERLADDFYLVFQISQLRFYIWFSLGAALILALLIGTPLFYLRRAKRRHEREMVAYLKVYRRATIPLLASRFTMKEFAVRHIMKKLVKEGAVAAMWDPKTSEYVLAGEGEQRQYSVKCPHCGAQVDISLMSGEGIVCPYCKSFVASVTEAGELRSESR